MSVPVDEHDVADCSTGRSRRGFLLVLLPVCALVLVIAVGAAVYERSKPSTPVAALQAYFDAEADGNGSRAWDLLCEKNRRANGSRDAYVLRVEAWSRGLHDRVPVITGAAQAVDSSPVPAWHVPVDLRDGTAGASAPFLVIEEAGEFRVCGRSRGL